MLFSPLGIGLLPYTLALPEMRQGHLIPILREYWQHSGGLKFCSPAVKLVVDLLSENLNLS